MGKKPWIIAASILGVLVVAYLGVAAFFMSHFLVNTSINGKDFSGKTVADVEAYLKEQVADYKLTILEQNNVSDVINGSDISLAYKDNSQVADALEQQSQLLWIASLFSRSNTDVTTVLLLSSRKNSMVRLWIWMRLHQRSNSLSPSLRPLLI